MATITMQEAQATLPELIHQLLPGEAVQITEDGQPVAVVTTVTEMRRVQGELKLGSQAGSVLYMAPDFDAPLDDFREYME